MENYKSAESPEAKPKLDKLFKSELEEGKISAAKSKPKCCHSIGAVPKKNSLGEMRPITDCSAPEGLAINNHIHYPTFKYNTVDSAINMMQPNCYFSVIDLAKAFRHVPVKPEHRTYQGFKWMFGPIDRRKYQYYCDNFLCFGLSCSPGIFNHLSNAVASILRYHGVLNVSNYLDDLIIVCYNYDDCLRAERKAIQILRRLGFSISWNKLQSATTCVRYLGIELCSKTMEARLPQDKLENLHSILGKFKKKKKARKRELESLVGTLNHCCSVVKGGRTFLRRIINVANSLKHRTHFIRLSTEFQKDLLFWINFSEVFNGKAKIIDKTPIDCSEIQCDSSFSGFGAYFRGECLLGTWHKDTTLCVPSGITLPQVEPDIPDSILHNINYLELFPVLAAARCWGHEWCNKHIVVRSDNTSVVSYVNKGTAKHPAAMDMLRELFWLSVKYNFHITSKHLRGLDNTISDYLSRLAEPNKWEHLLEYVHFNDIPLFLSSRSESGAQGGS